MEVRLFSEDFTDTWDAFVADSRNGTLFHTRKFLSYHPEGRFRDHSLLFFEGGRLLAVLPAAVLAENGRKIFRSHPGSTYGGLVLSPRCSAATTFDIVSSLLRALRSEGCSEGAFLRLTPAPLRRAHADDQEYALHKQGFRLLHSELGSIIDLRRLTVDTLLSSFDTQCRNEVRQAERAGVSVNVCGDYDAFFPLLASTLEHRHHVRPTHSLAELKHLAALFPDALQLFGAFHGGRLIAGVVTFDVTAHAVYTKYIAQDYSFQKMRGVNLLLREVLHYALRSGKTVLDLGVSMDEKSPKGINEGLFAFKEGFGACAIRRESFTYAFS